MRYSKVLWCVFSLLFLLTFGCDKVNFFRPKKAVEQPSVSVRPVKGALIAKVNNIPITLEELDEEIKAFNAMVPEDKPELKIVSREGKVDYLKNELVRKVLLYQTGLDKGIDRKADIQDALEKTKMDLVVVNLIKEETEKIEAPETAIKKYYDDYKEQFKEPEERQAQEIVVLTEQEAKDILIQLLQGANFATLAMERSKSKTAKNGGDTGYVKKGAAFKEMDNILDTLEVGQVSTVFKGPEGYYIVRLTGKRGGKQKTFEELHDDIKRGLTFLEQQKHLDDLIAKLSRETKIEIYEGEIK